MNLFAININRGISILGVLFLGIILILVLSYYHISIRAIVESPETKDNIGYVSTAGRSVWNDYFKGPVHYLWNDVWINIFWKSFISNMERIRDGKSTDYQNSAPSVNFNGAQGNQ